MAFMSTVKRTMILCNSMGFSKTCYEAFIED